LAGTVVAQVGFSPCLPREADRGDCNAQTKLVK
jgi:hypothetical protein